MNITLFFTPIYYIYSVFIAIPDNSTNVLFLRGNSTAYLEVVDDYTNFLDNSD